VGGRVWKYIDREKFTAAIAAAKTKTDLFRINKAVTDEYDAAAALIYAAEDSAKFAPRRRANR